MENTGACDACEIKKEEYPVNFDVAYPENSSRLLALIAIPWFFLKVILLIPHYIVIMFLGIAATIAVWFSYWAILFTGKYPRSLFNFVVGTLRWQARLSSWMFSLTDKYPPFTLEK